MHPLGDTIISLQSAGFSIQHASIFARAENKFLSHSSIGICARTSSVSEAPTDPPSESADANGQLVSLRLSETMYVRLILGRAAVTAPQRELLEEPVLCQ